MSKQKLTIENLAPYLPYEVKVLVDNGNGKYTDIITGIGIIDDMVFLDETGDWYYNDENDFDAKLVLRPLSDLTKEDYKEELLIYYEGLGISIKHIRYYDSGNDNIEDITIAVTYKLMDDVCTDVLINRGSVSESPYHFVKWLHQNHFDTDGLIEKGLAININDLKNEKRNKI